MAIELIKVADGASVCRISDPAGNPVTAPVIEISQQGAVIKVGLDLKANDYLDLSLELRGQTPRRFFAHVVGPHPNGFRIRWAHLDPNDDARLKGLIDAYRGAPPPAAANPGTRRIIRPRSAEQLTPSASAPAAAAPTTAPAPPAPVGETSSGTRRVIRPPSAMMITPFGGTPAAPAAKAPAPVISIFDPRSLEPSDAPSVGDSSGHKPVVIAPTARFEQLKDQRPAPIPAVEGEPAAPQPPALTKDGRMDVGQAIRNKAKTVRASDLAARHDKVRVLNLSTIKALIQEAVEESAGQLTRSLGETERKRLMDEAEENFKERLKAFQEEKASAEERARDLQNQLATAQNLLLDEKRKQISADQFTVSEAGLVEIDIRLQKTLMRAIAGGGVAPETEAELREIVARVLDSEREKIREKEALAHSEKIQLLERKIQRLATTLEDTERQRDEAREIAQAGGGGNYVDGQLVLGGIKKEDANRERKLALMKELIEANREIRRQLGIALNQATPEAKALEESIKEPPPSPAAADAPAVEPADRAEAAPSEPEVNPDDQPWDAAQATPLDTSFKTHGDEGASATSSAEPAEPAINPDDLPWEPPVEVVRELPAEDERGVKRITSFKKTDPPPLNR